MMQINLESGEPNAIESYSDNKIRINSTLYEHSLMVSREKIISDLPFSHLSDLDSQSIDLLKQFKPEVIVIGHESSDRPSLVLLSQLSQDRIGVECMSLGAACRTYNILLGEYREVVGLFILRG